MVHNYTGIPYTSAIRGTYSEFKILVYALHSHIFSFRKVPFMKEKKRRKQITNFTFKKITDYKFRKYF